jgi:hypothetical protein
MSTITTLLCQSCNLRPPSGKPIEFDDGVKFHVCHDCRPIAVGLRTELPDPTADRERDSARPRAHGDGPHDHATASNQATT